jgi:hypothetical protein
MKCILVAYLAAAGGAALRDREYAARGRPIMTRNNTQVLAIISQQLRQIESLKDYIIAVTVGGRIASEMLAEMDRKLASCVDELGGVE